MSQIEVGLTPLQILDRSKKSRTLARKTYRMLTSEAYGLYDW